MKKERKKIGRPGVFARIPRALHHNAISCSRRTSRPTKEYVKPTPKYIMIDRIKRKEGGHRPGEVPPSHADLGVRFYSRSRDFPRGGRQLPQGRGFETD